MFISLVHKRAEDGEPEQAFIVAHEGDDGTVCVSGSETLEDAQKNWSEPYNRNHMRSYEGSMSACVHFIMFQPTIHKLRDMDELNELVVNVDGMAEPISLSCVAGRVMAFPGTAKALEAWNSGVSAELINEDFNRLKLEEKRKELAELEELVNG
mgnify:CR=1 FL=1